MSLPDPRIYEVSITGGNLTTITDILLPILDGYDWLTLTGCAYVDDGKSILVFGEFERVGIPSRQDVVVKVDLQNNYRTELIQMPPMDPWYNVDVSPSSDDNQSIVYLFAAFGEYGQTPGFYRYDVSKNEAEFFEISGLKDDPWSRFSFTTTLFVKDLNRLYIFGGYDTTQGSRDSIWYVDLDPPTTTTVQPSTTTTVNPDLFNCEDRKDDFYPNPLDCSKYFGCHNGGEMTHYQCPPPLLFDPYRRNCNLPSFVACDLSCEGRLDGLYHHPQDCALYIICNAYETHVYRCPSPLLFNRVASQCDLPQNVDCYA